jgi:hypothetical protein
MNKVFYLFILISSFGICSDLSSKNVNRSRAIRNFSISMGNSLLAYALLSDANPDVRLCVAATGLAITLSTSLFTTPENAYEKIWGNLQKINKQNIHWFIQEKIIGEVGPEFVSKHTLPREEQIKLKYQNHQAVIARIVSFFKKT